GHGGCEGQRRRPCREGLQGGGDPARVDVDLAVAERAWPLCPAVVQFVGMQHEHLPREAALNRTPVVERLDPLLGDADRIDIVPVAAERAAAEASAKQFDALHRTPGSHPLIWVARTFKTSAVRSNQAGCHTATLRSGAWKSCMTPIR